MEIYKIEDYKKTKKLVYFDEGTPAFCLYNKEIRKYELHEGMDLDDDTYGEIIGLLSKRARERCLYLLDDMSRTERQLRDKLREGYYPEEAIESAVSYCREKHYVDDVDYAVRFIEAKSGTLSKRVIEQKLYLKGIDRDTMAAAFEQCEPDEAAAIKDFIIRRYGAISGILYEDRQKLIKKLLSKGFAYDSVKTVIATLAGEI